MKHDIYYIQSIYLFLCNLQLKIGTTSLYGIIFLVIKYEYKNIEYYSKVDNITVKSDLIFANSVLCRWPESEGEYTFDTFENTLELIDNLLNKDGYLCIYNSKYLFCETNLFLNKKYEKIETSHKETGFVTKYHNDNKKINDNYPFFLFRKTAF